MSHHIVGDVINCLLTDADLRVRFLVDPIEALLDLSIQGFDLTQDEIELLVRADARTWCWNREFLGRRVH